MPPTDVNDRIAIEVMGYVLEAPTCGIGFGYWIKDGKRVCERSRWKPLDDLNQCALAEAAIGRRWLWREYQNAIRCYWKMSVRLQDITFPICDMDERFHEYLIRLTPEQRTTAMLSAIGAKPAADVGLSGVAEAHWAAVEKAIEREGTL